MIKEEWKDIKGLEGLYQISNLGNARSLPRVIKGSNNQWEHKGKVLRIANNGKYDFIKASIQGKSKIIYIHQAVAVAFIPNPNNLNEVNHIDENKTNNCVDNLEWCTHKYNMNYGSRNKKISIARRQKGGVSDE